MMKKTIILDTNVYLTEAASLLAFGKDNIAIPTIVLDEIDKHKHRQDTAGLKRSNNEPSTRRPKVKGQPCGRCSAWSVGKARSSLLILMHLLCLPE